MSLAAKLLSASGGGVDKLYVDDVFSAYTYTGNGSTQTINNGIDLSGEGGLVWNKCRSDSGTAHWLWDTVRAGSACLTTSGDAGNFGGTGTNASTNFWGLTPSTTGYSFGGSNVTGNAPSKTYVSWTFRKAPKFFDIVTYTGNGVAGRQIPHALGIAPGMVIVKRTDSSAGWMVYHRSITASSYLELQSTNQAYAGGDFNSTEPTSSVLTVGATVATNASGGTYVAYLFAHDPSADGIIQCGSFTTDGSGNATVNLGLEPQYLMVKRTDTTGQWYIQDTSRGGLVAQGTAGSPTLIANLANAESNAIAVTAIATGFTFQNSGIPGTYIYMAVRRPNKPPTLGTQVYNAIARTGTGSVATVTGVAFAPDALLSLNRNASATNGAGFFDRLRGPLAYIRSSQTAAEYSATGSLTSFNMDGITVGVDSTMFSVNTSTATYGYEFFKRAPGVFDVVCYTGTGADATVQHNLGVAPELMIIKSRSTVTTWPVFVPLFGDPNSVVFLNLTDAKTGAFGGMSQPTSSSFLVRDYGTIGSSGVTYVAYLFATKAGISKVGSYTGNGTSQTIDAGFTTGARFVLIKRTDAVGDWYVWDTVRGLVAGNDPHLSLNTTAAEVTSNDSLDPASVGFVVNQLAATNVNVTSATYIYLAFA